MQSKSIENELRVMLVSVSLPLQESDKKRINAILKRQHKAAK